MSKIESVKIEPEVIDKGECLVEIPSVGVGIFFLKMFYFSKILELCFETDGKKKTMKMHFFRNGDEIPNIKYAPQYLGSFMHERFGIHHIYITKVNGR